MRYCLVLERIFGRFAQISLRFQYARKDEIKMIIKMIDNWLFGKRLLLERIL